MTRAPFQVAVYPYRTLEQGRFIYAVFRRRDGAQIWQAISGGGEDTETPLEAARREAWEEAVISPDHRYLELDSRVTLPIVDIAALRDREDLFVIPEYSFAVEVYSETVPLSEEHVEMAWLPFTEAQNRLRWENNKHALWELDRRLCRAAKALQDS